MDGDQRARPGQPVTLIGRASCALPVGAERRAGGSVEVLEGRREAHRGRPQEVYRRRAAGAVLLQDHQLCAGLHAAAGRGEGEWLEPEHGRDRADVARRMHHSQPVPGQDQGAFDKNPSLTTCCWTTSSPAREPYQASWRKAMMHAIKLACPRRLLTALAFFDGYRTGAAAGRTCCRRSATSSARILTSASISRAASSPTPTGPDMADGFLRRRTRFEKQGAGNRKDEAAISDEEIAAFVARSCPAALKAGSRPGRGPCRCRPGFRRPYPSRSVGAGGDGWRGSTRGARPAPCCASLWTSTRQGGRRLAPLARSTPASPPTPTASAGGMGGENQVYSDMNPARS